jgi:DNA-binding HxlR family transcriptional regulator
VSPESELSKPGARICSVTDAVAAVGDRYSIPIVRELLYGNHRFSELATLTGAPRTLLSGRLRKLEDAGVIERRPYSDHPPRDEYLLTEAGRELLPVLIAFKEWGDRHCHDGEQTAIFQHVCGSELHTETVCRACRQEVRFEDLVLTGGTHPPFPPS